MEVNFTAALCVLDTDWHVTLTFGNCIKGGKVRTTDRTDNLVFTKIEYWDHCDLTVGLVKSALCDERALYWQSMGYPYDLGYKPHVTLSLGNSVSKWGYLLENEFKVGKEYFRLF